MNLFLERMKNVDAFYANRMQDKERRERLESGFEGVFRSLTRLEPVKFDDMRAQGVDFKKRLMECRKYDYKGVLKNIAFNTVVIDRFAKRNTRSVKSPVPYTPEAYAASESLALTAKQAFETFLASDNERMMFLEDDAMMRTEILDSLTDIPDADMIVWGGCTNGLKNEAARFAKTDGYKWRKLNSKSWHNGAQAFELNRKAASEFLKLYEMFPAIILDQNWLYLFDDVEAYSLMPVGIIQSGLSVINGSTIRMPLTKQEAMDGIEKGLWMY